MKKLFIVASLILLIGTSVSAQKYKPFTVYAGTKVQDYIPFPERYRYTEFIDGMIFFKNGSTITTKLNYNFLSGEMDYPQAKDTLSIANVSDIKLITISGDIFYYDKGYLELIYDNKVKVAVKQYIKQIEVLKKDSYGSAGSNSATDSYSTLQTTGQSYKLVISQDRVFQKLSEFYIATPTSGFDLFTKKRALQLFPQQNKVIKDYLKSNKVDFDSREDLIRFAGYLSDL